MSCKYCGMGCYFMGMSCEEEKNGNIVSLKFPENIHPRPGRSTFDRIRSNS